jgi:hypothetical protein
MGQRRCHVVWIGRGVEWVELITVQYVRFSLSGGPHPASGRNEKRVACHDPSGRASAKRRGQHGAQSERGPHRRSMEDAAIGTTRGKKARAGSLVDARRPMSSARPSCHAIRLAGFLTPHADLLPEAAPQRPDAITAANKTICLLRPRATKKTDLSVSWHTSVCRRGGETLSYLASWLRR